MPEVVTELPVTASRDHRVQNVVPAVHAVDVTGPQGAALQITELAEAEQRVVNDFILQFFDVGEALTLIAVAMSSCRFSGSSCYGSPFAGADIAVAPATLWCAWQKPLSGGLHAAHASTIDLYQPMVVFDLVCQSTCINPWVFSIWYAKGEVSTEVRGPE